LEGCRDSRSSPEDGAMEWDVEVEDAISGQRLFRRAEDGSSRMPVGRRDVCVKVERGVSRQVGTWYQQCNDVKGSWRAEGRV
jgi:hypothetical protein